MWTLLTITAAVFALLGLVLLLQGALLTGVVLLVIAFAILLCTRNTPRAH